MKALEMGNPVRGKHVFVVAGLRGCDWIAPLTSLHVATTLLGRAQTSMQRILDAVRFHFVFINNPDGYAFSRRKDPKNGAALVHEPTRFRRGARGGLGAELGH